jgi:predicted cation transporter
MTVAAGLTILAFLLIGPLAVHFIERNIEIYCLLIGILAVSLGGMWSERLIRHALTEPLEISAAVVIAGLIFNYSRHHFDRVFARMRSRAPRSALTAMSIFLIAMLSSLITAIIAALVLVEVIGLLRFDDATRARVAVAGCFAIGMGAALTPIGEPLSTLAARALHLNFIGLFLLLAPYLIPGVVAAALLAAYLGRGRYELHTEALHIRQNNAQILKQALKVFGFIAGLVLISEAYARLAAQILSTIGNDVLFWVNMISAALDNATLVALEVHNMELYRAREAIISLVVSGGMLVPGNIPNIVSAGAMRIRSTIWAKMGVPVGIVLLSGYFLALKLIG